MTKEAAAAGICDRDLAACENITDSVTREEESVQKDVRVALQPSSCFLRRPHHDDFLWCTNRVFRLQMCLYHHK